MGWNIKNIQKRILKSKKKQVYKKPPITRDTVTVDMLQPKAKRNPFGLSEPMEAFLRNK